MLKNHLLGVSDHVRLKLVCSASETSRECSEWLSGRVLDSRPSGHGFDPQRRHCFVVLEQDTFILA